MTVVVQVPGGEPDEVTLELGSGEAESASVTSTVSDRDLGALLSAVVGAVLAVLGLVLLGVLLVRRRRKRPGGDVTAAV
ncbi:MAG: hypothetical protein M5U19_01735 [Microthrixaceae bacterium]|nr:hypothetical protein [Microthrixaceae bacterium]